MRDGEIDILGGIGGTHARTEDLDRAAAMLARARERIDSVAAWARAARAEVLADPRFVEGLELSAAHVDEALAWVNQGPGGAEALARELGDTGRALAETVTLLEDAERHADGFWQQVWNDARWIVRHSVAAAEVGIWASAKATPWLPEGAGLPPFVRVQEPDWTTVVDPDIVEAGIGLADSIPIVPWITDFSVKDLLMLVAVVQAMRWAELLGNPRGLAVKKERTTITTPPRDAADLLDRIGDVPRGPDGDTSSFRVAVEKVSGPDGETAWIVEIPGTASFLPTGGSNSGDIVADGQMMVGATSDVMVGVVEAMRQAGIGPGEPVLLAGHSLGGIASASLASNAEVGAHFRIQAVVTAGSCVAPFAVPDSTSVLSFENTTDVVPALDGARNPDQANWVTVRHDLRGSDNPLDREAAGSVVDSHEIPAYRRTAARFDASSSVSAASWRDDNAAFFADGRSTSTRTVYAITRGTDDATLASVED